YRENLSKLEKMSFMNAVAGLSDAVKFHLGKALHESDEALRFGLRVVSFMKKKSEEEGERVGLKIHLDQSASESTVYRFAKLDLIHFPKQAREIVHGSLKKDQIYYTNSSQLDVDAQVDVLDRIEIEGRFHPLLQGGALTHIWLGENKPSASSMARLVKKIYKKTQNTQVAFSPEFTRCTDCGRGMRGIKKRCCYCHSRRVDWITRVTGYYSFVKSWNRGKRGELKDRQRDKI
ncbi:anaerobic ribonucleoside-triphosphate reductase, partial [Patescibacteria group bacterium]